MKSSKVKRSTLKSKRRSINKNKIRNTTKRKVSRRNSRKKRKNTNKKKKRKSRKKMKGGGLKDVNLIVVLEKEIPEINELLKKKAPEFYKMYGSLYNDKIQKKIRANTQKIKPLIKDETKDEKVIKQISYLTKDDQFYTKEKPSDYYNWWLKKYKDNQKFIKNLERLTPTPMIQGKMDKYYRPTPTQEEERRIKQIFIENPKSCLAWDVYEELKYYLINLLTSILNSYLKYKRDLTKKEGPSLFSSFTKHKIKLIVLFEQFDVCLKEKRYYYFTELHLKYIDWYRIAIKKEPDTILLSINAANPVVKCDKDTIFNDLLKKDIEFKNKFDKILKTQITEGEQEHLKKQYITRFENLPSAIEIYEKQISKPMVFTLPLSHSINVEKSVKLFAAPIIPFITKHTRVHDEDAHPCYQIYHDLAIAEGEIKGGHYEQYYFREDNKYMELYFKKVSEFLDIIFDEIKELDNTEKQFFTIHKKPVNIKLTDICYNLIFMINHEQQEIRKILYIYDIKDVDIIKTIQIFINEYLQFSPPVKFNQINFFQKIISYVELIQKIGTSEHKISIQLRKTKYAPVITINKKENEDSYNKVNIFLTTLKTQAEFFNNQYEKQKNLIK